MIYLKILFWWTVISILIGPPIGMFLGFNDREAERLFQERND